MRRRVLLAAGFVVVFVGGLVIGDHVAGQRNAQAMQTVSEFVTEMTALVKSNEDSTRALLALESLGLAQMLRAGDVESALQTVESRMESQRRAFEWDPPAAVAAQTVAQSVSSIESYFLQYPYRVPQPSPQEERLLDAFGRLTVMVQDGRVAGMRVSEVRDGSLFSELRLNVGDVIVSLDGSPLSEPEAVASLYEAFENGRPFEITVRTAVDQEHTMRYVGAAAR
jgi:membrane-associated protease RseP (regulator of RpoE activity)